MFGFEQGFLINDGIDKTIHICQTAQVCQQAGYCVKSVLFLGFLVYVFELDHSVEESQTLMD